MLNTSSREERIIFFDPPIFTPKDHSKNDGETLDDENFTDIPKVDERDRK